MTIDLDSPRFRKKITETQLFDELSDGQRRRLLGNAIKRAYQKNATIFASGDESTVIYYVVSGRVKIFDVTGDGREIIYRVCGANNWFGVSAIFGGKVRPVFAQSQAQTEVLIIERATFEDFIHDNPDFAVSVIYLLGQRLRQAHAAITEFVVGDVRSRIAQLLLKFAEAGSTTENGVITIENRFTHQEIASMIGATRTTVTKVINHWKRHDIVRAVHGRIQIRDYDALARLVRH